MVDGWARNHAGAQAQGNFRGLHRVVSTHIGMFGRRKHAYISVCVYGGILDVYIYILRRLHMVSPKFLIRISTKAGVLCMGVSRDDKEQAMCTGSRCSMSGLIVVYI